MIACTLVLRLRCCTVLILSHGVLPAFSQRSLCYASGVHERGGGEEYDYHFTYIHQHIIFSSSMQPLRRYSSKRFKVFPSCQRAMLSLCRLIALQQHPPSILNSYTNTTVRKILLLLLFGIAIVSSEYLVRFSTSLIGQFILLVP